MPSNLISLLVKPIFILVSQANPNDIVKFFTEFAKHIFHGLLYGNRDEKSGISHRGKK